MFVEICLCRANLLRLTLCENRKIWLTAAINLLVLSIWLKKKTMRYTKMKLHRGSAPSVRGKWNPSSSYSSLKSFLIPFPVTDCTKRQNPVNLLLVIPQLTAKYKVSTQPVNEAVNTESAGFPSAAEVQRKCSACVCFGAGSTEKPLNESDPLFLPSVKTWGQSIRAL